MYIGGVISRHEGCHNVYHLFSVCILGELRWNAVLRLKTVDLCLDLSVWYGRTWPEPTRNQFGKPRTHFRFPARTEWLPPECVSAFLLTLLHITPRSTCSFRWWQVSFVWCSSRAYIRTRMRTTIYVYMFCWSSSIWNSRVHHLQHLHSVHSDVFVIRKGYMKSETPKATTSGHNRQIRTSPWLRKH